MRFNSNRFGARRRDSGDLTAIIAADTFATLCAVWLAMVNPHADSMRVKAGSEGPTSPSQQISIHVSTTHVSVDGGPPMDTSGLASQLAGLDEKPLVRIRLDPDVGIAREHAVLAVVTDAGISDIALSIGALNHDR